MPNETATTYLCISCNEPIIDHAYLVQRRRVRPLKETLSNGTEVHNLPDFLDGFHAGIQVGPESDYYCSTCFAKLPSFQELIDVYKSGLDKERKDLD